MASPQKENGYTAISNEILEALILHDFSKTEMKIIHAVLRKTYGFGKKKDRISLSQFKAYTGMDRSNIHRTIARLHRRRVLVVTYDNSKRISYQFQKNYEQWKKVKNWCKNKPVVTYDHKIDITDENNTRNKVGKNSKNTQGVVTGDNKNEISGGNNRGNQTEKVLSPMTTGGQGVVTYDHNVLSPMTTTKETKQKKETTSRQQNQKNGSVCPHQKIVDLWHEKMPELPRIKVWHEVRQQNLRARWNEDKNRQNLEWWERFFAYIRKCDFLMGRVETRNGKKTFMATLDWAVVRNNFVKIIEGKYE